MSLEAKIETNGSNFSANFQNTGSGISQQNFFGIKEIIFKKNNLAFSSSAFPEGTMSSDSVDFSINIGEKYRIVWDGKEYFSVAKDASELNLNGMSFNGAYLGNPSIISEEYYENTEYPFLLIGEESSIGFITKSSEESHNVQVQTINELDVGWLNEETASKPKAFEENNILFIR